MCRCFPLGLLFLVAATSFSQSSFDYTVAFQPILIPDLPGLHSFAFAQDQGKWLVMGGRKDGIHARQPFNAFPESENNTDLYVIDVDKKKFWKKSVNALPAGLKEQLQSTNMNYYQDGDTLVIIGGYGYSRSAGDHVTFPYLTLVRVRQLIDAIIGDEKIQAAFTQISDTAFAVTGGHLGKIGDTYFLVGGQRFDGRYNPMGHPTFSQRYTNQIRKFRIDPGGKELTVSGYSVVTDPLHLRRRDYNLLPQIFPDGRPGYTISSGVFQIGIDLPFLYPVDIRDDGYTPVTTFNQHLSNYHSAFACLYDSLANEMHTLFFGGISQYYYANGTLIRDDQVPFVSTISRMTRETDGTLHEYPLDVDMPGLRGASAEFIPDPAIPHYPNGVINLNSLDGDTVHIGYILGGLYSSAANPFQTNSPELTSASGPVLAVQLIWQKTTHVREINGTNPYDFTFYPNPADQEIIVYFQHDYPADVISFITDDLGRIVQQDVLGMSLAGPNEYHIPVQEMSGLNAYNLTMVFENHYYVTKKIAVK